MRYPRFNSIKSHQIKSCNRCGAGITFAKNASGKWLCVDVVMIPSGPVWLRSGNNNNSIPTHRCTNAFAAHPVLLACQTYTRVYKCLSDSLVAALRDGVVDTPEYQKSVERLSNIVQKLRLRVERRLQKSGLSKQDIDRNIILSDALRSAGVEVRA